MDEGRTTAGQETPTAGAGAAEAITALADYPLYVVTAAHDGERSGCVAGFVTQCSIVPPRFLVCISKVNHTFGVGEAADSLALHLLGADQEDMASLFAERSGDTVDKFTRCDWYVGAGGSPVLEECAAWIEGRVTARFSTGDHEAFVVSVLNGGTGPRSGRLMYQSAPALTPGHPA